MNELQILDIDDEFVQDEAFQIKDINTLNWAFRRLSAIRAKENEVKGLAKAEIARIKEWEEHQLKMFESDKQYFEYLVQDYHFRTLLDDPKAKTISTPYGKSKSRLSKAQPEKTDDKALLDYVLDNDMQDYIKKDVRWGDLKKNLSVVEHDGVWTVIDDAGQIVPGVVVKPESINYSIEIMEG